MFLQLPIDAYLPDICAQLRAANSLVLVAEPGAGKTTRLPAALLDAFQGQILVLEPRRVAAVAAADRIASERGWRLGQEVGYRVRFENKTSRDTRLIFMTEALLSRRLLQDSELNGVSVVVLDEFHERSLHVDLALGLLREMQELGRELKIVIMSATLEAEKISAYLGGAPIVRVPGALHPLTIHHLDKGLRPFLDNEFYNSLVRKIKEVATETPGDLLVFLPGVGEIHRTQDRLEDWAREKQIDIVPLHGSLHLEEQRRALQEGSRRRVVLATNVAESSLTVPGVRSVIDSGFAKVMVQDLTTGFSRLELNRISLSSAKQRAGRAARTAPGSCHRLWSIHEETSFKRDDLAEVMRADLSESVLFLAALGVTSPANFSWFERPRDAQLMAASAELRAMGALDEQGVITAHGRRLAALPLPPQWANFLLLSATNGHLRSGALVTAMMQERDFVLPQALEAYVGDGIENDIELRLQLLEDFAESGRGHDIKKPIAKTILATADQLMRLLEKSDAKSTLSFEAVMLKAFAHLLCRRRQKTSKGLMVGGRGVRLSESSVVKNSEFFLALQGVEGHQNETQIGLAFGLKRETVLTTLKDQITEHDGLYFDEAKGQLFNKKARTYLDLPLEEDRLSPATATQSEEKLAGFLADNLEYVRRKNEDFGHWLDRWAAFAILHGVATPPAPALLLEAFQMAVLGEKRVEDVLQKNLGSYLESVLDADLMQKFRKDAPMHFAAPTGSSFKIQYPPERAPFVEVRLQELFGTKENPKLLGGKMALQFHLLGPNYRPVQVTSDIASFWQNTYPEVRKELRARYPKHSWPDNPLEAPAVRKGRSTKR